jgi:hypothetical protein
LMNRLMKTTMAMNSARAYPHRPNEFSEPLNSLHNTCKLCQEDAHWWPGIFPRRSHPARRSIRHWSNEDNISFITTPFINDFLHNSQNFLGSVLDTLLHHFSFA